MMTETHELDELFPTLASTPSLPPVSPELAKLTSESPPVRSRQPVLNAAIVLGVGLVQAAVIAYLYGIRRDIVELPPVSLFAYAGLWLAGFAALAIGSQVPARGAVMPKTRLFGPVGVAVALMFVAAGLLLPLTGPTSFIYPSTLENFLRFTQHCLTVGMMTSVIPTLLAGWLGRGSTPRGAMWLGAATGAASGSLGGLVLLLHCPIAEHTHLGFIHGGVVVLSALVGAIVVPLIARTR